MKLTINLVVYNGAKYLPFLFESLKKQSFKNWILNVIDNNSTDGSTEILKKEMNNLSVLHNLEVNKKNTGFTDGHNHLSKKVITEYFLILNQDIYLEPDCLKKMVNHLDNSDVSVVSPRLMKWDFEKGRDGFTSMVDSMGLKLWKSRRVTEIGVGEKYIGDKKYFKNVFGVSGTCVMYQRSAIERVLLDGEMFDSSYFMYKEDVDLAYRLFNNGYRTNVLVNAVAYHDRSGKTGADIGDKSSVKNKKEQNMMIKYNSYRNHLATIYKNIYWQNLIIDFPYIFWYEFKKFIYFLFFDRNILKGLVELHKKRHDLQRKRAFILKNKKEDWKKIREVLN